MSVEGQITDKLLVPSRIGNFLATSVSNSLKNARASHPCERGAGFLQQHPWEVCAARFLTAGPRPAQSGKHLEQFDGRNVCLRKQKITAMKTPAALPQLTP
jgi:hypothetical protein